MNIIETTHDYMYSYMWLVTVKNIWSGKEIFWCELKKKGECVDKYTEGTP